MLDLSGRVAFFLTGAILLATKTEISPFAKRRISRGRYRGGPKVEPAPLANLSRTAIFIIGSFILYTASAFGQMNTGEIAGQVKDPSGAAIPGATVVATQGATQQKFN